MICIRHPMDFQKEPADVAPDDNSRAFVCFASKDGAEARVIVQFLERAGVACWISLRDVAPGENYQEAIVGALERAKAVVFLFSENSAKSHEIRKELALADLFEKPVFPVRLSLVNPDGALRYELATCQWIDIFPDHDAGLSTLARTIRTVLGNSAAIERVSRAPSANDAATPPSAVQVAARALPPKPAPADEAVDTSPIVGAGTHEFEAIRVLLAQHIGPVAKILVARAATEAHTPDDFCEKLALHVCEPSDRARFVHAVRAHLPIGA